MLVIESRSAHAQHHDVELVLPFELRQKSRLRTRLASGEAGGLFLARGLSSGQPPCRSGDRRAVAALRGRRGARADAARPRRHGNRIVRAIRTGGGRLRRGTPSPFDGGDAQRDHPRVQGLQAEMIALDALSLTRLLQLASPVLPVGAYSYSQGLEAAIECRAVTDANTAQTWIRDILEYSIASFEAPVLWRLSGALARDDFEVFARWNALFHAG